MTLPLFYSSLHPFHLTFFMPVKYFSHLLISQQRRVANYTAEEKAMVYPGASILSGASTEFLR